MLIYETLTNDADLIAYEQGLYEAFSSRNPDNWLTQNYLTIDGCRFRSRIPYRDQVVYAARDGGRIVAAGAVNFNVTDTLQLEEIGFFIDKEAVPACEGLLLFTDGKSLPGERFLEVASGLFRFIESDLIGRGMVRVYGTCSRPLRAMYTLLGFQVIDRLKKDGETKLLLAYDLQPDPTDRPG